MIAAALAWKFNNAEGITTSDGEIVEFPDHLEFPEDLDALIAEYEQYLLDNPE